MATSETGCAGCSDADPDRAFKQLTPLPRDFIIQESHFAVGLLACPHCGQRFASVFSESIDWAGGNDPVERCFVPLSADEAAQLLAAGEHGVEAALRQLPGPRRYLLSYWSATATSPTTRWVTGAVRFMPHD